MNIVVSGGWSYGNIGDEAIAAATIYLVKKYFSNYEPVFCSYNPADFEHHHGIESIYSLHKILECGSEDNEKELQMFKQLFDKDSILIISGGGYISGSWDSQIESKIMEMEIALSKHSKVFLIGQSIGPINNNELEKKFIDILKKIDYISVRDVQSVDYLVAKGIERNRVFLAPDLAIIISDIYPFNIADKEKIISIMPACYTKYQPCFADRKLPFYMKVGGIFGKVINRVNMYKYRMGMISLLRSIPNDYQIQFVLSTTWNADMNFVKWLISKTNIQNYTVCMDLSLYDLCKTLSKGRCTISSKMHPLIISSSYYIPVIGISYNFKTDYFMGSIGRNEYCLRNYDISANYISKIMKEYAKDDSIISEIPKRKKEVYDLFCDIQSIALERCEI